MLKCFRTAVVVGAVLCLTLSGAIASAEPVDPDTAQDSTDSADGQWRLHVKLEHWRIESVPNMAATAFTREAYISATATVSIDALDQNNPTPKGANITQRSISLWLQEGCQATMGQGTLNISNTATTGLSATTSPAGGPSVTPSVANSPDPQYGQALAPGTIVGKNLQNKAYPDKPDPAAPKPPWLTTNWGDDTLTVSIQNWDLKVDACAGPVSFRFIGEALMYTQQYTLGVDTYSNIVQI